jgi:hypothetical protein
VAGTSVVTTGWAPPHGGLGSTVAKGPRYAAECNTVPENAACFVCFFKKGGRGV